MGKFGTVLNGTGKRLGAVSRGLKGAGSAFSALTFPILGAAAVSGKLAIDFDRAMRNVNSIAQLPERQLQRLRKDVLSLAGPTAQAPQTLAEGLYTLVSSGFDARQSLHIMKSAANAATAGLTEAATSTKVMAAVLNAYRLPASKAKSVSDILFRTVDRGVITFEELAQNIGDTLPFAASLGVSLTEVGAATATMTKQGLGAPETMTRIRNLLQTMIKPGEGLKKAFKELGVESGETLIKQKGFQGALEAVIGSTDGSKRAVAKLFPNIRALGGALALTGGNSKAAAEDLKGMQGAGGATSRALKEQAKSMSFQWNRFMANLKVLAIELGTSFMPVLEDITGWLGKVAKAFRGLEPGQKKMIVITLLVLGVLGPLLIVLGAIAAAGAALATTAGLVVLGVVAVGAAAVYAYTKFQWFRDIVNWLWEAFKKTPLGMVVTHLGDIAGAAVGVGKAFGKIPGAIKSAFVSSINWMIDRLNDFIGFVNAAISTFNKLPGPNIGTIGEVGHIGGGPAPGPSGTDYGGFNPLMGRPSAPTGPIPFGGRRRGHDTSRRGGPLAHTASTGRDRDTVVHSHLHLDGREVARNTEKHSKKAKAVR
jgi:TP901 family phage tail tape measure protein